MISSFSNAAGRNPRRNHLSLSLLAACGAAALAPSASTAQGQAVGGEEAALMMSTLPAAAPPTRCVPPPPDMDAWYPLDGNGTDLVLGNNATPTAVAFGSAVVAGGARLLPRPDHGSFLTVPNGPVLNQGLGDFSIDLWLFVPPQWLTVAVPHRTLIDKRTTDGSGGIRGYALYVYGGRLGIQLADGPYNNFQSANPLAAGWNHVAVSVDRDNPQGIVFYRNGAPNGILNPTARQGNLDNSSPTLFGRNVFSHDLPSTGAVLDEIEFFDRVLRPAEVRAIFAAGPAGKCKP